MFKFMCLILVMSILVDWITKLFSDKDIDGISAIVIAFSIWYLIQVVGGIQLC